jgi:hypothetical protein
VLILSYETFRLHEERFKGDNVCDLLICDEAHRLKNDQTLTNKVCETSWHFSHIMNLYVKTSRLASRAFSGDFLNCRALTEG